QDRTNAGFHGTTQSEPVWPMLLILLTSLIAGELILSGIIARERFGSEPIAESSERSGAFANPFASEPAEPKQRQSSIQPVEEIVGANR
ncbi:MAG TPA: hypothetical protein VLA12_21055, partial [Planctomycetaceae bacterium]|nr:hypothetical protein [Planctomycetaceae bacterium]